jgi:hypothetical protein
MSFRHDAFYLIEPRPELVVYLRGRVEPDFAELLLEPRLLRRLEVSGSWLHADRVAQTKLLFLASLREYTPIAADADFETVFGSPVLSVGLFDRWFVARRMMVDCELEQLEVGLREPRLRVEPTGRAWVDSWLSALRGANAEPSAGPEAPRD